MMPALLIRMSRRPNCSTAASTSACAPASVATSFVSAIAAPPAATISAATDGRGFGVGADALHRAAEVVDDDAGASVGEQACVRPADAASRAGDDRDAPLEAVLVHPEPFSCRRVPTSQYTSGLVPRRGSVALSAVLYSSSDRVGVITLNRPEARNAVNRELALGLEAAVDRLEDDPEVWVGVLGANTGDQAHPVFCAGADLKVIRGDGFRGDARHRAGRVRRVRVPRAHEADRGRRRRSRDRGRSGDRPRGGRRRGDDPIGVRARGGPAQLDRRGRRAVPAPARDRSGQRRWTPSSPASRSTRVARSISGLVSRLVEPGAARDEALRVAQQIVAAAPLAVRASRRVVLAAGVRARRHSCGRLSSELLDELLASEDAE